MFNAILTIKILLSTTIYVGPSASDQLAMERFRTTDVEFAREAMAEADAIDAEIATDGDIPGWRYRAPVIENPKGEARLNGSFCQISDGAL